MLKRANTRFNLERLFWLSCCVWLCLSLIVLQSDAAKKKKDKGRDRESDKDKVTQEQQEATIEVGGSSYPLSEPIPITTATSDVIETGSWFIEFYAPWCGYCKKLAPTYAEFAGSENAKGDFLVANVNCEEEKDLCAAYGVKSYPTLKAIVAGMVYDFSGSQTVEGMGNFVRGILEDVIANGQSNSAVEIITANNFDRKVLSQDGAWFIDFYAPWCSHCKELEPEWELFAKELQTHGERLTAAKVDCEANLDLCEKFNIPEYPSLKLVQLVTFTEERTASKFHAFWSKYDQYINPQYSDVVELDWKSFYPKTRAGTWLIDFYLPWCGHCKSLAPILEEIASDRKGTYFVGKVNCQETDNRHLCDALNAWQYPSLAVWKEGDFKGWFPTKKRTADNILEWLEGFEEEDIPEEERDIHDVISISGPAFRRTISKGNWIVEFHAPWCSNCQAMEPIWQELAVLENPYGRATVAKLDCTRHPDTCSFYKIESYPAILFFQNGKVKDRVAGYQNLPALRQFITANHAFPPKKA